MLKIHMKEGHFELLNDVAIHEMNPSQEDIMWSSVLCKKDTILYVKCSSFLFCHE